MKCELCNKEHDGSYGSGRFCSEKCARSFSTKSQRKQINQKISKTMSGRKRCQYPKESIEKQRQSLKTTLYHKYKNDKVKTYDGSLLDITKKELEQYRQQHLVCEICGKVETSSTNNPNRINKLSVDHDHATNKFRGLLCRNCNSRLGWYENHKDIIDEYLKR